MTENTIDQSKAIILSIFADHVQEGSLPAYLDHIGFDVGALTETTDFPKAILGYYRIKRGHYDVDRATLDLANYPPIASRIVELQAQRSMIGHNSANSSG